MLAFVHTVAQDNPRMKTQFVILEIEARFLPFALLFLNFVARGPTSALVSAAGLGSAHLFDFLTRIWPTFAGGRNWIETPIMVRRWFGDEKGGIRNMAYGQAHYRGGTQSSSSSSASSSVSTQRTTGSGWSSRGAGRRLGE